MGTIEKYVTWAVNIANDNSHGYSQAVRWSPDYDCSSFVISALEAAGFPMSAYGASYTGNMGQALKACGFVKVRGVNLASSGGLIRGDILLNPATHTEIYIGDNKAVGAHCSESGGKYGKTGDQTGNEISIQTYRNKNYTEVWRYGAKFKPSHDSKSHDIKWDKVAREVIRGKYGNGAERIAALSAEGYTSAEINEIQQTVNYLIKGGLV